MDRRFAATPLTPLVLIIMLALTGCGGGGADDGGVASAGAAAGTGGTSSAAPGELTDDERNLRFAECLRGEGIDVPDPAPGQNGPGLDFGGGAGAEVDRAKLRAAIEACVEFAPNGGEPPQLDPEQTEQFRQLAKCMRENGVPDFPDPSADGRIRFGELGIDPQDPAVRAAFEKCQELVPNLGFRGGDS